MAQPPRKPSRARKMDRAADRISGVASGSFEQPLPAWIKPCLPTLVTQPPEGPDWSHEIKWDGYRVSAYLRDGKVTIRSRNGHDWTNRFPVIAMAVEALPVHSAVIDGEAVVLDELGRPDFGRLQAALGEIDRRPGKTAAGTAILYAFDLLFLDGHDLREWSLDDRRDALLSTIGHTDRILRFSEALDTTGAELFAAACAHGLEGIVSKRRQWPYRSGPSKDWLKTKCVQENVFVVIGYQPSAPSSLGAIHVAEETADGLRYAGTVGTGFSIKAADALKKRLDASSVPDPAVSGLRIKGAKWARPELRVDVKYRARTREGMLRHASFKGMVARALG